MQHVIWIRAHRVPIGCLASNSQPPGDPFDILKSRYYLRSGVKVMENSPLNYFPFVVTTVKISETPGRHTYRLRAEKQYQEVEIYFQD